MSVGVSRDLVRSYFQACVSRDAGRLGRILDDDVRWSCAGPVDLIHYCGQRRGKESVIDAIVRMAPTLIRLTGFTIEQILIEGDRAATFSRLSGIHAGSGRTLSYRCAQFLRFRDGKLVEFSALMDSLDAAEQMLGHPIAVAAPHDTAENVFAV